MIIKTDLCQLYVLHDEMRTVLRLEIVRAVEQSGGRAGPSAPDITAVFIFSKIIILFY